MKVSFCVTNRNRLEHAKKTIPRNLEMLRSFENTEMVLLNYGSEEDLDGWVREELKDWILSGKLIYGSTKHPKAFRMAHAKNCSHMMATGNIVVNIDSDNWLSYLYIKLVLDSFKRHDSPIVKGSGAGLGGRIAIRKDVFELVGGYDERLDTWGYDDKDFFDRAILATQLLNIRDPRRINKVIPFQDEKSSIEHSTESRQWGIPNLPWYPGLLEYNKVIRRENLKNRIWNPNATNKIDWGKLPDLKLGLP